MCADEVGRKHGIERPVQIVAQAMTTDFASTFEEKAMMKMIGYDMAKACAKQVYEQAGIGPEELIERIAALHADPEVVAPAVAAVAPAAREHLNLVRTTGFGGFGYGARSTGPVDAPVRAGLLLSSAYSPPEHSPQHAATLLQRRGGRWG